MTTCTERTFEVSEVFDERYRIDREGRDRDTKAILLKDDIYVSFSSQSYSLTIDSDQSVLMSYQI